MSDRQDIMQSFKITFFCEEVKHLVTIEFVVKYSIYWIEWTGFTHGWQIKESI